MSLYGLLTPFSAAIAVAIILWVGLGIDPVQLIHILRALKHG